MRRRTLLLVAVLTIAAAVSPVQAGPHPGLLAENHPFDTLNHGAVVGATYPGYTYDPGTLVFCVPGYNYAGYPPTSGSCIAGNISTGVVTINAQQPRLEFEVDLMGFNNAVLVRGLVSPLAHVAAQISCTTVYTTSQHCVLHSTVPFNQIQIIGTPGYWGFDSVRVEL